LRGDADPDAGYSRYADIRASHHPVAHGSAHNRGAQRNRHDARSRL
jgi:hypothetical protein